MDLPPFHHHHRYVPFSDNHPLYQPQPHRLPPHPPPPTVPPLPPTPPPLPHHLTLPPPPPLPPPVQSQFSFLPNSTEEISPRFFNFIPPHLLNHLRPPARPPSPPRVSSDEYSNRDQLRLDDMSRFSAIWPDLPPLPRAAPVPPLHYHNHHRPASPLGPQIGSYSNDFQPSFRFQDEFIDEGCRDDDNLQLPLWGRKDIRFDSLNDVDDRKYIGGRERYEWNSNLLDRDFISADSQGGSELSLHRSRNAELNVGNYELYEDLRWRNSSLETDRNYGNNNGVSLRLRGKRQELFDSSGFEDASRYNNSRLGGKRAEEFFNRSPGKKQLQKKSALQRIQLGKTNNNRNRSHDYSHLSKSYHDEPNSGVRSFKEKEKDVSTRMEHKMEDREKSPMELDVSFKSNALVAKAIKASPSPVVDSSRNLTPRNRKIRKLKLSDSPGVKLSEHADDTSSSMHHFDNDHREFSKTVISDKNNSHTTCASHRAASRYKCQKSAENVSAVRTDSYTPGLDIRSDSDNDLREFVKKIGVSACDNLPGGSQPCSSDLGGYNADKEFPKALESVQDVKSVSFDIDGTPRKRKRVAILLQSKKDGVQPGLEGILREEGLSSSADIEMVPNVALEFLTDDKVKSSSEYVSDVKKDNMDIVSFQLLLPQSSAMISVLQNSGDAYACEAADHAEISVHDGYSDLNPDKIVEHSYQDKPKLFENGPGGKVMDSVKGNALKESKVHNVRMEDYASRNEGCSNSSPEPRLWRISEQIDVSESVNANTKDPSPNEVSISETNEINDCSPNPVSSAGNCTVLCLSPKSEDSPKENTSFINSTVDLEMDSQETTENFAILINLKAPCGEDNCESNLPCMKNIASLSKNLSSHVGLTNSVCRLVDSAPEALFNNMMSSEEIPSNLLEAVQNGKSSQSEISNGLSGKEKMLVKSPASGVETVRPTSLGSKNDTKLRQALTVPVNSHKVLPVSQYNSKVLQNSNSLPEKPSVSNNSLTNSIQRGFLGRKSLKYPSVGKAPTFNHVSRPRTWHRIGTPSQSVAGSKSHVSSQINSEKEFARVQNSYIRKGNSLVRKPSPVGLVPKGSRASIPTLNQLNPGIDNLKKARGSGGISNVIGPSTSATVRAFIAGPERPKTPPLTGPVKSLNCKPADQGDSTCSQADPFRNHFPGETLDPSNSASGMGMKSSSEDGVKPSEDTNFEDGSRSNLQGQSTIDERNSGKKITYVKRKSNQLIATNNSCDPSCQSSEKPQALSSEGYYKRRKNQLIRTSVEDNVKQRTAVPGRCLSSERQETAKNARNSSSRQNGFWKKKFSLVWTLHSTLSSKKDGSLGHFRGVRPFLFPWKRATYRTDFTHSLGSKANDNLASSISRKLLLSQKSNTIYKRSISGFSLRRSKVLGFYGRSLKWSKSIERNSRKANEDATLAVAAAEKRKSEQNGAALPLFKSRNYVSRERIFRIGSERYRMDPTGKTLQRISEDTTSYSEDQSENNTKKSFVPRRLLIGNDEYVRIGNGNQLVRDPKKRTRALASEKVRWSLHTARLRLARKKKYCQFFTRFGKCKDDKRCSYIHDPSKIVVCTKFLNGCCSNSNCKLTHKVIPERMQDCSYFLQGLCSNESCPYRHVNVNPNSPVCEGFLRGHCADGNECRKKHTYVCPAFEATGNCQLGSKCKLHHPKTKRKGMKSKASTVQKNGRGLRYFGAGHIDRARSSSIAFPKIITGEGDDHIFCQDGKFTDFISLADSEEAMEEEAVEARFEPSCDSSDREEPSSDIQEDLDELIKPIRIMKKDVVLDSSPAIDNSRGATSGSYVSEESWQNN